MNRFRWWCLQGIVLAFGVLWLAEATAQRGGMCSHSFSMSSQINVQMYAHPMQSMNYMFGQQSFHSHGGYAFGMSSSQGSCGSQRMSNSSQRPSSSGSNQFLQSRNGMTPTNTSHQMNCSSGYSMFNLALVNSRPSLSYGLSGQGLGGQPTFGRMTSLTTISLDRTTYPLSTGSLAGLTTWRPQINLIPSARQVALPGILHQTSSAAPTVAAVMKWHQLIPEFQMQLTTTGTVTCGRCHQNGAPQEGLMARVGGPVQHQMGPMPQVRVNSPVAVRQPVVSTLLMIPELPDRPALNLVATPPVRPPVLGMTADKTISTVGTVAPTSPGLNTPTDSTVALPFDRQLPVTLDAPPLPVSQTIHPAADQTTDILDRLPTATAYTLAPKPSSVAAPLSPADVDGPPALPGGVTLPPLVVAAPEEIEPVRAASYQGLPPMPQPGGES